MDTLRERLLWARTQKSQRTGLEFTQEDLAAKAGVTQGNIAHLESGRTLTSRNIAAIAAALDVDVVWLSTGKGQPSRSDDADPKSLPGSYTIGVSDHSNPRSVQIAKVELKLSAGITGYRTESDDEEGGRWDLPRRWVEKNGYSPARLLAIDVKGDSMEPTLYEGDVVVINTADTKPVDGQIYAVNYEGEAVIKRLEKDGPTWYLTSDNDLPKYRKKPIRPGQALIVGRIVRRETDQL